jgi:hypothetical protein
MNLAIHIYEPMKSFHDVPFKLSDALLVLFLHDLEKPWRFLGSQKEREMLEKRENREPFKKSKFKKYSINLNSIQENALDYVEGEISNYSPLKRTMNELATFCHICDVASARLWYNYPIR